MNSSPTLNKTYIRLPVTCDHAPSSTTSAAVAGITPYTLPKHPGSAIPQRDSACLPSQLRSIPEEQVCHASCLNVSFADTTSGLLLVSSENNNQLTDQRGTFQKKKRRTSLLQNVWTYFFFQLIKEWDGLFLIHRKTVTQNLMNTLGYRTESWGM